MRLCKMARFCAFRVFLRFFLCAFSCQTVLQKSTNLCRIVQKCAKAVLRNTHPGRNDYKIIPWNNYFCNKLCNYYQIIPPKHLLCGVAASGLSLFAREHAKEFAL